MNHQMKNVLGSDGQVYFEEDCEAEAANAYDQEGQLMSHTPSDPCKCTAEIWRDLNKPKETK